MHFLLALLFLFFASPCLGSQSFEPLFMTDGVAPIQYHPVHQDIMVLHSAEQFVRFVSQSGGETTGVTTLVHLDNSSRDGHGASLNVCAGIAANWPRPLKVVSVRADTHAFLVRAIARTAGLQTLRLPSVLVFVGGKAVLPVVAGTLAVDEMTTQIAQRIAYAQQQQQRESWFGHWWQQGSAWAQGIWGNIQRYLFG